MQHKLLVPAFLALMSFAACKTPTTVVKENRNLPVMEVTATKLDANTPQTFERGIYNPSYLRRNDLLHTKLDVRFDWSKQHVIGKAYLTLKPVFYDTDSLRLDAKGFDIKKVALLDANNQEIALKYEYSDAANLRIKLDKSYNRNQEYNIYIEYVAKPNELPVGGSSAITQDKGLYFINPLGTEGNKPQQIWTQGETESNSKWFPTIDRPNERCTQEIFVTVEDKFRTLSNGLLKSSTKNTDGTRTDYWVMDKPHAPYLFMLAIGEFATVKDTWEGIELEYIVEKKYEKDAKAIYPYTPEMLTFFSEKLGKYPWQKYSQVVVRDYVSGAMENTTAVIFGDFVQKTAREIADNPEVNENIVAHEMIHHWFGDLVTCESWSNLPLNEAFANYSEYMWQEYKHGADAAEYHRMGELQGYMNESMLRGVNHPLINFAYVDKEDMFNAHSYNKGGLILHMLRRYVGDDAFYASLRYYLDKHQYQAAEVHDLRLAFEKVTGEDLNWFFNQWFLTARHPELSITRQYDKLKGEINITLEQTQDFTESTIFILPMNIDIYTEGSTTPQRHRITMKDQKQTFSFKVDKAPVWVAVDATRDLLYKRSETQTAEEWIAQFNLGKTFLDRYTAMNELKALQKANPAAAKVYNDALSDKFWVIRSLAIDNIENPNATQIALIEQLAKTDARPDVRVSAVERLAKLKTANTNAILKNAIENEQSYMVMGAALNAFVSVDKAEALKVAKKLENEESGTILTAVARIYSQTNDKANAAFYEKNWSKTDNYATFTFLDNYAAYLINVNDNDFLLEKANFFKQIATTSTNGDWTRYGGGAAVRKIRDHFRNQTSTNAQYLKVNEMFEEIKKSEKNQDLKTIYSRW